MQRILLGLVITFLVSCSSPTEIVKSDKVSPNCPYDGNGNYNIVMEAGMENWSLFYQPEKNKDYPYEKHNAVWFELQKELAELSANSTFVASDKNHYLKVTDADLIERSINVWLKNNIENEK